MRLQISKTKNAESFYIVESTYVNGRRSNKIVEKLGTKEQIVSRIGPDRDPYKWGRERAAELTRRQKENADEPVTLTFDPSSLLEKDSRRSFHAGYLFLQKIYHELGLDRICSQISQRHRFEYDLNRILSRLIYARILSPSSKRRTLSNVGNYLEAPGFDLQHVYRALSVLSAESDFIQSRLYSSSCSICDRHTSVLYYDCTNYYFEIEEQDNFRKYGFSKEHRPNPLVQMGLFMDADGIPLAFSLSPGNTNEQTTLRPLEKKIIRDFGLSKFILCTDAGLSSTDNRKFNSIQNRSFVTIQSLKKLKNHLREWSIDSTGFRLCEGGEEYDVSAIDPEQHMSSVFYKDRWINEDGFEQHLIVTYSPKYAAYQKRLRERHILRAEALLKAGPAKIERRNQQDVRRLLEATSTTPDGEIAEKTSYSIDNEKIAEETRYDGFYASCTDLDDVSPEILKVMKGRWEIEECFRILKTDFEARPVYLSREDRIQAHFLTCFIALMIYRILERRIHAMDSDATIDSILHSLRNMNMIQHKDMYIPSYDRTHMTDLLHEVSGFRTDYDVIPAKKMRKILKASKSRDIVQK